MSQSSLTCFRTMFSFSVKRFNGAVFSRVARIRMRRGNGGNGTNGREERTKCNRKGLLRLKLRLPGWNKWVRETGTTGQDQYMTHNTICTPLTYPTDISHHTFRPRDHDFIFYPYLIGANGWQLSFGLLRPIKLLIRMQRAVCSVQHTCPAARL